MAGDIIKGIPFDASEVLDESGDLVYDYTIFSQDLADWWGSYFTNGILVKDGEIIKDELKVEKAEDLSVTIKPGVIMVNGRTGPLKKEHTLLLDPTSAGNKRIDRVVIELNLNESVNEFRPIIVKGAETTSLPQPPQLKRDEDTKIYQMSLAKVEVNQSTISSVTDERTDDSVCGLCQVTVARKPALPVTGDDASNIAYDNEQSGLEGTNVQDAIDDLNEKFFVPKETTVSLSSSSWGSLTQTVTATGFKSTDKVIADIEATSKDEAAQWGNIWKIEILDDQAKFYATKALKSTIKVKLRTVM